MYEGTTPIISCIYDLFLPLLNYYLYDLCFFISLLLRGVELIGAKWSSYTCYETYDGPLASYIASVKDFVLAVTQDYLWAYITCDMPEDSFFLGVLLSSFYNSYYVYLLFGVY